MSLLNKKAVKEYALFLSRETRGGKFTRVSPSFSDRLEAKLRTIMQQEVHAHPSVGMTLK